MALSCINIVLSFLFCVTWSHPLNNTTDDPECNVTGDCGPDRVCVNLKCVDPCQGVCGINSACYLVNLIPVCSCKPGFSGHPFTGCFSGYEHECTGNIQCAEDRACLNHKCVDPCLGSCGVNTECRVINHYPICACSEGFVWNLLTGCQPKTIPQCNSNAQCTTDRACINQKCVDPCIGVCGNNTVCNVTNHYPACACSPGSTGNPFKDCKPQCAIGTEKNKEITRSSPLGKKKFYVSQTKLEWRLALEHCRARGMDLASVQNDIEQAALTLAVRESGFSGDFWSSGMKLGESGNFFWVSTGAYLSYTNWISGEPTGSDEYCIEIRSSEQLKWRSYRCGYIQHFICEYYQ